jgi:elongation factor Ts
MTISASLVKELRERTSAGMMECKRALEETNGDIDAAAELMRKKGQAKADKKSGRIAAEGIIILLQSNDRKSAVILEVNCETDFVARDENFKQFAHQAGQLALQHKIDDIDTLSNLSYEPGYTVEQMRTNLIVKIGENISLRRIKYLETDAEIAAYIHGNRIGVLVEFQGGDSELGRDLAMHIAASNPIVVAPSDVPDALIVKEREIFTAQADASGKPADIIAKMVDGRIKKYLNEVSLMGQPFVKNPDLTVEKLLQQKNAKVQKFVRFEVGEGIEKVQVDFAREVMEQVKGS